MATNPIPLLQEIAKLRFEQQLSPLAAIQTAASRLGWKTDAALDLLLDPARQAWVKEVRQ